MHRKQLWIAALIVLWIAGVIAIYYVVHKPWSGEQAAALFHIGRDLLIALVLVSLAGGLGRKLLSLPFQSFLLGSLEPMERLTICAALGLGTLSLGVLFVGLAGGLNIWIALSALLVGIALLHRQIAAWARDLRSLAGNGPMNNLEKIAGGFVLLLIILNLTRALAPPLKWDSLVYHLQIPQAYLAQGRIFFYPENFYAGFSQISELLFTWVMSLGSATTAATLGWLVGILALLGVEGFSRRLLCKGSSRVHWLAPAILLTGYSVSQAMNWAYLELWTLLFGIAMWIILDYYCQDGRRTWLIYASILLGFTIGVKYTAILLVPIAGIFLLPLLRDGNLVNESTVSTILDPINRYQKVGWRRWFTDMLIFSSIAGLVVLPWLVKNLILADNPFYPFLTTSDTFNPWRQTFHSSPFPPRSLWRDVLLPIEAVFFGLEGAVVVGYPEYGASLGPLMLALIPGLLVSWSIWNSKQKLSLKRLLGASVCFWVLWGAASHVADELMYPRQWFGVYGALSLLAVAGSQALSAIRIFTVRLGRVVSVLVILAISLAGLNEVLDFSRVNPLPVVLGNQSEEDYLQNKLGWYAVAIEATNKLPEDSRILMLWEPRTFYCRHVCFPDGKLNNWWYLFQAGIDSTGIAQILTLKGVTHVLVNDKGLEWITRNEKSANLERWIELDEFTGLHLHFIQSFGESYSLYSFESRE